MLSSIKSGIKASVIKVKNKTFNKLGSVKRSISRYRWRILIVFSIISAVSLVVALVMSAYEGNDVSQQAVIINYTEAQIKDGTYSNKAILRGLNSKLYSLPKRKFILFYGDLASTDSEYRYDAINGRVLEGTKVTI